MEFNNKYLCLWGLLGGLFWGLNFFQSFKKPEIFFLQRFYLKGRRHIRTIVFLGGLFAWGMISFSLMNPRYPLSSQDVSIKVNDILFVVDVSRSMLANDFDPNRLEVSKRKIKEFLDLRLKDRIGIIIFSEKAFTLLPLTTDYNLTTKMVNEIKVGFLGSGTNIGDALGLAIGRAAYSLADNKVIILLTDGVSNVGSMTPLQSAEEARRQGVKVYTIGVGGKKDAKIPSGKNIFGHESYQNIPGGSIDFKGLKKISEITNGKAYLAENEGALKDVFNEIDKLERTEILKKGHVQYKEVYLIYLVVGVLSLVLVELIRMFSLKEHV
jgi:Ca-activated chloride channel family protein